MPSQRFNRDRLDSFGFDTESTYDYYGLSEGYVGSATIPYHRDIIYDRIADSVHKRRPNKTYPVSDVFHVSTRLSLSRAITEWLTWRTDDGGFDHVVPRTPMSAPLDLLSLVELVPVCSDDLWHDLAMDGSLKFSEQVPPAVSILNFLWELRELPAKAFGLLSRLQDQAARIDKNKKILELIAEHKASESIEAQVASSHLELEFDIKPFVGDLRALVGIIDSVTKRLEFLRETWGKYTHLHHEKRGIRTFTMEPFRTGWIHGELGAFEVTLQSYRADFRCSGILFHTLDELNGWIGLCRALFAGLGLNNPLGVVWEALPYSFVVDWVLGVGRTLRDHSFNPFPGSWVVMDSTCTISEKYELDIRFKPTFRGHIGTDFLAERVSVKRYTRCVGFPVKALEIDPNALSPARLALLSALFTSAGA